MPGQALRWGHRGCPNASTDALFRRRWGPRGAARRSNSSRYISTDSARPQPIISRRRQRPFIISLRSATPQLRHAREAHEAHSYASRAMLSANARQAKARNTRRPASSLLLLLLLRGGERLRRAAESPCLAPCCLPSGGVLGLWRTCVREVGAPACVQVRGKWRERTSRTHGRSGTRRS